MKYYAENREEMDRQKQAGRNNYKWLLKKEEQKVKAKGPDPEQMKAQAIVNKLFYTVKIDENIPTKFFFIKIG